MRAGGGRGDEAEIGRRPAGDIVAATDAVARDRHENREIAHLGASVARAAVIFSSARCRGNLKEPIRPRLRVGLQSTLGLSPDSSVAIDRQDVSPEPGACYDTAGSARTRARRSADTRDL